VVEYWSDGIEPRRRWEPVLSESRGSISRAPRIWTFLNSLESEFFNSLVKCDSYRPVAIYAPAAFPNGWKNSAAV
jgi:hypothetical protein